MKKNLMERMTQTLFGGEIRRQVRAALSAAETEASFLVGARSFNQSDRDRFTYDREKMLELSLEAWRVNPLARRIVELTSQYVVGGGINAESKIDKLSKFISDFWNHRLNRMDVRAFEWCDELTRTGNLFILLSTDQAGMTYVRAFPATAIAEIETRSNDVEQPTYFKLKPTNTDPDPTPIPAYDPNTDSPTAAGGYAPAMLHYAINRPVGAAWGESDLAPLLKWLSRYANWLEDRARLNRFRTAFLYVVKARFQSEAERLARQSQLNVTPPSPGSILVTDESETWEVLSAKLDSVEANSDGLAIKKMIAAGAGIPMHFLAEPESATRTTAEAAGGPTFRHFEQRQRFYLWMLEDILSAAIHRRAMVQKDLPHKEPFTVKGSDISARDNVSYGMATTYVNNVFGELRDRNLIDDSEYLRMIYRFSGESADVEEMLKRGAKAPMTDYLERKSRKSNTPSGIDPNTVDPDTGEPKQAITGI